MEDKIIDHRRLHELSDRTIMFEYRGVKVNAISHIKNSTDAKELAMTMVDEILKINNNIISITFQL
jgi:hypothetical protein